MMRSTVRAALALGALLSLAGCPSCGPAPTTTKYTIDNLCDLLNGSFQKWHAIEYGTCGAPVQDGDVAHLSPIGNFAGYWDLSYNWADYSGDYELVGDKALHITCTGDLKDDYEHVKESVKAGRMTFDAASVEACIAAGKDAKATGKGGQNVPDSCKKILAGAVAENGACSYNYDCTTGLYCKPADSTVACTGTCQKPLPAGSPCTAADRCAVDTACTKGTGTPAVYTCTALPGLNQPCPDGDCASGLYCAAGATTSDPDTCKATKNANAACESSDECSGDLVCRDPAGGQNTVCTTAPALSKLNEPCGGAQGLDCDPAACLYCDGGDATNPGVCKAVPHKGETCGTVYSEDDQGNPTPYKTCDTYGLMVCDETNGNLCIERPRANENCLTTETDATALKGTLVGNCMYYDNFCKRSGPNVKTGFCAPFPKVGEVCGNKNDQAPVCPTGSYCRGMTSTASGVCSALEPDGTACQDSAICASGLCVKTTVSATSGTCGQPAPVGSACAIEVTSTSGGTECAKDAKCDSTSTQCVALAANGATCTASSACLSGSCDTRQGKCAIACQSAGLPSSANCWVGLDWFSRYVFASGALVFLATRRRRKNS
jgi:hypothetical protein